VLRHRIILSYEALAQDVTAELVVDEVLRKIPMPRLGLPGEEGPPYQKEHILRANTARQEPERRRWRLLPGRGQQGAQPDGPAGGQQGAQPERPGAQSGAPPQGRGG
jgi:hypothetical protein